PPPHYRPLLVLPPMNVDPIPFRPFMPTEPVEIYTSGYLPHWRQSGSTYFVTFRTADSLPQSVLAELAAERAAWLARHGGAIQALSDELRREFAKIISASLEEKLDHGCGDCPLRDPDTAKIVADALRHFSPGRLRLGDFVVMPNHVHALITPATGRKLESLLQSIKNYSGRRINQLCAKGGTFWQRDSYDHIVRTGDQLRKFQRYIANNPAKANLRPGEYIHQTASYLFD
ncbi:MAG: transposase, partial [Verrucomicrobiales bacterium]|nr:transposase [Verrucomicrobiales bacterium]